MSGENIRVSALPYSPPGGTGPLQVLAGNGNRVWVIVTVVPSVSEVLIANVQSADLTGVFESVQPLASKHWTRHDYGDLVTGEWWITNGAGDTPNSSFVVTEGVLTS